VEWIKAIAREVIGLFVDDGSFAAAIVIWLGVVWLLSHRIPGIMAWSGIILFAGLGLILLWSTRQRSRQ